MSVLGEKNSLDAWHIHTAEQHGMFCFLCIDFPLRDAVEHARKKDPFRRLKTEVLLPSELGQRISLLPVDTNVLSYVGSSFPVHHELSWPNQKRNPPRDLPAAPRPHGSRRSAPRDPIPDQDVTLECHRSGAQQPDTVESEHAKPTWRDC